MYTDNKIQEMFKTKKTDINFYNIINKRKDTNTAHIQLL